MNVWVSVHTLHLAYVKIGCFNKGKGPGVCPKKGDWIWQEIRIFLYFRWTFFILILKKLYFEISTPCDGCHAA